MKFYDFVLHLLKTVWKNIEKERNAGISMLMRFLWDTRYTGNEFDSNLESSVYAQFN